MGEKRCPECGHFNPRDADFCESCQASLPPFDPLSPLSIETNNQDPTERWFAHPQKPEGIEPTGEDPSPSPLGKLTPWMDGDPLAGLQGTLQPVSRPNRAKKTPTQPAGLKVTAIQRSNADLFRQLIDSEAEPIASESRPLISSHHLLRWGVAALVILVLIWPIYSGSQNMPLPAYQPEIAELNRLVNELPDNARVLISFDYDASFTGEMEAAASAVIDHLMLHGARLTIVSTLPAGPLLAERFLTRTQSEHNYIPGLHYVNLGYIPGGIAGLAGFLENPGQTLPYSVESIAAWQTNTHPAVAPLQGITSIADFEMILLLVADADTARMWIEQLKTFLAKPDELTSLTIVASAQAEAIVFPYFENDPRQVHGIVAGLRGGAAYARLTGRNMLPLKYWDAYGFGMFLAAMLMLIGGLTHSVLSILNESSTKRQEIKG